MRKKLSFVLASVLVVSFSFYSFASASEKEVLPASGGNNPDGYVYLNGAPIKENTVIYANEENQEELVEKYGLEKPSPDAKLVSIQIVNNEDDSIELPKEESKSINPQAIFGYRIVKGPTQSIDGWTEIARAKYFCNKPSTQQCKGIEITVSANESVSVEVQTSLSIGVQEVVAAEFGYSLGQSIGVSTSVMVPMDIQGGKTGIAVGYPIYNSTFCEVYEKGILNDKYLGGATFLKPKPSSIAVTSWTT